MKVDWRVLLVVLFFLLSGNFVVWSVARLVLLPGYAAVENDDILRDLQRVRMGLQSDCRSLSGSAENEASWDASYQFIQDHNQGFIDSDAVGLKELRLDLAVYLDRDGKVVHEVAGPSVPAAEAASAFRDIWKHPFPKETGSGVLLLPSCSLLIGYSPILHSDSSGPAMGGIVLGRILGGEVVQELAEQTRLQLALLPAEPAGPDNRAPFHPGPELQVRFIDNNSAEGELLVRSLDGRPAARVIAHHPRTVYLQGKKTVARFLQWTFAGSLASAVLIYLLLVRLGRIQTAFGHQEQKYQRLFDSSQVPTFEEDFSAVVRALDSLRSSGVKDLRAHIAAHQDLLGQLVGAIRFTDANRAAVRSYRFQSREDLLSSPEKIIPDTAFGTLVDLLCAIWDGEPHFRAETSNSLRDGSTMACIISLPLPSGPDDARGIPVSILDISSRVEAERLGRQNEERLTRLSLQFQKVLDSIPDGVMLLTPDLRVEWVNRAATAWRGASRDDLIGTTCFHSLMSGEEVCADCPVRRCFADARVVSFRQTLPGGTVFERRFIPVQDDQGATVNMIVYSRDLTDELKNRAETIRTGQLASLGELAAGVAHEINNPINGIINYAQIMLNKAEQGTRDCDFSQQIIREGDRIARIVSQLLAFARGNSENHFENTVEHILEGILPLIQPQLRVDGISLKVEIPSSLPLVRVCPQQIQQVVLNLLNNAKYAILNKEGLSAEDKVIVVNARMEVGGMVRICICDKGIGIPAEVIDKIMNPFFTTKPQGVGTGLGLSISHGIVASHKGKLTFDSIEGEGTRASLDLPAVALV